MIERLAALDLAGLRLARTFAHTPSAERTVRAFSALGQHGACWLVLGATRRSRSTARVARRWRRATVAVAAAYGANQAVKLAVGRRRARRSRTCRR